jgi:hypothetical protein
VSTERRQQNLLRDTGEHGVTTSVLEAVKQGQWDFEPPKVEDTCFASTRALPGSNEKLTILAQRIAQGLPLWHSKDCRNYAEVVGDTED